jgi:hypothetical protein
MYDCESSIPRGLTRNLNYIGKSNWADPNLAGYIDEFRVWNILRSPADILANYRARIDSAAGLLVNYHFDEVNIS